MSEDRAKNIAEARAAWLFNVGLECDGPDGPPQLCVGGAILNFSDLYIVLRCDDLLAQIGEAGSHDLNDVELEAALAAVGIFSYGPDAERFEVMFQAAMKARGFDT